jgi:two-component system, cell cycle sensor histidine kinase and response regulator CckA
MHMDSIERDSPPRWLIGVVAGIFLILTIGGAWFSRQQRNRIRQQAEEQLLTIARFKANEIAQWRAEKLHDAAVLAGDPFFLEAAQTWMRSPDQANSRKILAHFRTIKTQYSYWNIGLASPEGKNLLIIDGPPGGVLSETAAKSLAEALRTKRVVMTDLIPGTGPLPVRLDTIAPLIISSSDGAVPFGALVLVSDVQTYLYPLIQSWPTPSTSAESLLVRRDGDSVLFLNELRHRQETALKLRVPLTQTTVPAVMAVLGQLGIFEGSDYRGVKVFAALQPVGGTAWQLVAKIDESEALAGWKEDSLLIMGLTISLFLAAAAMVWAVWQRRMKAGYRLHLAIEKARSATEKQYGVTLMCIGDGVIVMDEKGSVTLLNPVAEELTGWTQIEAQGKPVEIIFDICNEDTRQRVDNPIRKVIECGHTIGLANHTVLLSRSGIEYPIMDSAAPIREANGDLIGIVLVFRDRTTERKAQRLLQKNHDLLNEVGKAAKIGGWELDPNSMAGTWTDMMYHIFDVPLGEKPPLKDALLFYHPDDRPKISDAINTAIEKGEPYDLEMRFITAKGNNLWIRSLCKPVVENGSTKRLIGVLQDITSIKNAEQQNDKLVQQLQQAMKMEAVGRLAGGVAHDFNNLLTGIGGYADLIISTLNPEDPLLADLNEIKKATQSAATLTSQLLAFSRKQLIEPRVLSLNHLISSLQKMIQRLIGEDIELNTNLFEKLASVKIDPGQFEQILINLAVNARDAMPDGGKLTIETANVDFDEDYRAAHPYVKPGRKVMLIMSDTGCGMSEEVKAHLFEPFYTTKQKGRGTGLGLATIYGIVKQSGGSIEVYSEPGEGTAFKIYLPTIDEIPQALEMKKPTSLSMSKGEETILLVEDERIVRELAVKMLKRLNYNVLHASNGYEALEIAQNHNGIIKLLITDVVMPGMNGRQLADRLLQIRPNIRVLFTSGYTENAIAHHGIIEKDISFIGKPYSSHDLANKIRQLLD